MGYLQQVSSVTSANSATRGVGMAAAWMPRRLFGNILAIGRRAAGAEESGSRKAQEAWKIIAQGKPA